MDFLVNLLTTQSAAQAVFLLSIIIAIGLAIGNLGVFGIQLGIAGVLFSGLFFGHFKFAISPEILEFCREFGLILFVYTIGLQVGPGFFASFKKDGVRLNVMAAFVVIAGALITLAIHYFGKVPFPVAAGLFSGATTNTPSLAAAQQTLKELPGITADAQKMPGLGYAVAYPFGILGTILTMLFFRFLRKISPDKEATAYTEAHLKSHPTLLAWDIKITNPNLENLSISSLPLIHLGKIVISRIQHGQSVSIATPDEVVHVGDIIRAVGTKDRLDEFQKAVGSISQMADFKDEGAITSQHLLVTRHEVLGKQIEELDSFLYGVTITRVRRGELELTAADDLELCFADRLLVVGKEKDIRQFARMVGNSTKVLNHTQLIPVFIGILLGIVFGSFPIHVPGIPTPIKLGLAGGPLILAILLSAFGRIGRLIWYMPTSANLAIREIGITLFLACVGLKSGDKFVASLIHGDGFYWMAMAALITLIPITLVAFWASYKLKMNYLSLCGLIAGSMTDPPALAFANQMAPSNAQVISYAAVYPLVMILRVIAAQIMILIVLGH